MPVCLFGLEKKQEDTMYRKKRSTAVGIKWNLLVIALAHLSLISAQAVSEYPPEILTAPVPGQPQIEGSSKTLQCIALGVPTPKYSWLHNGTVISRNKTSGYLSLTNLQQSSNGFYRCLAENSLGAELSLAAELKIAALRPFTQTGPQIVSVDQGRYAHLNFPSFSALALGQGLTLTWEENNITLPDTERLHIKTRTNNLVLLSVDNNLNNKEYRAKADYFPTGFQSVSSPYVLRVRDLNNPSEIAPELVVSPRDTFVKTGKDAVLECVINARPIQYLTTRWYKESAGGSRTLIQNDAQKYLLTPFNRQLWIRTVDENDSGVYMCEGQLNNPGSTTTYAPVVASANLTIEAAPLIPSNLQPKKVERDFSQSVLFLCHAQGVPQPTLEWFFNGRPVSVDSDRHTVYENGSLEITNLDLPDAGKYQCFAKNDAGEMYIAVRLQVNSAPAQITRAPGNLTIVEQSDARFYCEVSGAPIPVITWKKVTDNGEQDVVFGGRIQNFRNSLLIAPVQKDDSGMYKCLAQNLKGEQSASAYLTVITKTQIIRPPQNQTVILSIPVRFSCGIAQDDNTVPVWEWFFFKNGDMSNSKQLNNVGRYQVLDDGTLVVNGVSAQDIGIYKCHVISAGGNDSRIASLKVIELPRPPTIISVSLNPAENNSVIIVWTKSFDGNTPLLKYIITYRQENPNGNNDGVGWDIYPEEISPSDTTHVVSNLNPSRYYRFRISALNSVGEGSPSQPMPNPAIKMPAQPPSSPPRNLVCTQGVENQIIATWNPPEESTWNGDLLGYVIFYKVASLPNSTLQESRVIGANQRSHTLNYLLAHSQYAVTIAAYNEKGTGAVTNPFFVATRQGRPTDNPKNLEATAVNSTAVVLRWDPPNTGEINGRNLGYMIEIRQNGSLVRSLFENSDSNNMEGRQETVIDQLGKFTEYSFTIACRTKPGLGPYSAPVSVKTLEDVPGPVHDLRFNPVQDQSVRVTWTKPSETNGILTGYMLSYEKKRDPSTKQTITLPDTVTYYTITRLIPVTNYTISVSAKTKVGTGQAVSADIQTDVPPEFPLPPYNLGYTNIGARTVLLQFFPGFDGRTSIILWIVLAKESGEEDYSEIYSISDPTAREIWVQNLKPYTKYQLKVIAENILGRSEPSEPTQEFETKQAAPSSPPGNVTVRPVNATALRISWTPISSQDWNGVPRGYKIDYRMWSTEAEDTDIQAVHETMWTPVELNNGINVDSHILTGLEEWMDYQIRMISYNDVGNSPTSPTATERTRESTPSASPGSLQANPQSSTQILVSWAPVPRLQENGLILGFKVIYKPADNSDEARFEDVVGKNKTNVTLMGLRKFVSYAIRILAYTRMGDGKMSAEIIRKTDEDLPGPPIILYFPNVTYTSAVVVWSAPSQPNGIIIGYKVSYRKQGETLPDSESQLGPNIFEYSVDTLERETYYIFSVTAKTRLGWGETASVPVLTMVNRDRPEQPRKPTVGSLQINARNITISWQPGTDNYSPVRNFTIEYKMRDRAWVTFHETIPPSAISYTVTGLRPNSHYQFRVAATNDIGTSNFSDASAEVKTLSDKPDGAPQSLQVVAVTRTSIRASWQSPREDTWNGLLLSYVVQYRQVQQPDFQEESVQFGSNQLLLSGLAISQTYEVQVLAVNGKGRGPPSTPATIYVGEAAPTAPPSNVQAVNKSASSIEVTWVAPPTDTQNGGLSGYKVLFFKNSSSTANEQQRISSETKILLEGLETFSHYFIAVQAYNLAGEGPRSPSISAHTSEGVPGIPGPLKFSNITMRQVTVSFQPPQQPNGHILLYEMEYFPENRRPFDPLPSKRVLRANETLKVVKELDERVQYRFRVSANTSVGRGVAQEALITTGPQLGSPEAPSLPTVSLQDQSLLLKWRNGDPGNSPIYGYLIQSRKKLETNFDTLQQETTSETQVFVSLSNLNPSTGYQFRIIAINDQGISEPSRASSLFTTPNFALAQAGKPFHTEWWFLVIIALTGVIVILVIISLLCLLTRRRKAGKEMKRSQTNTTVMSEPSEPEEGGFPTYEMRQSQRNTRPRNGSVKNIYARPPPRPSPASVAYSDDDDAMSMAKPPIPDDSSSCMTDKPSDLGDSTEVRMLQPSDEESEPESDKVPASPPPPAFTSVYANNDNVRQSWRFQNPNTAYAYTDSEADSSHYAFSLNNGQLVVNNVAGARTPLTGFSSFV